jgi:hypothetical protein
MGTHVTSLLNQVDTRDACVCFVFVCLFLFVLFLFVCF